MGEMGSFLYVAALREGKLVLLPPPDGSPSGVWYGVNTLYGLNIYMRRVNAGRVIITQASGDGRLDDSSDEIVTVRQFTWSATGWNLLKEAQLRFPYPQTYDLDFDPTRYGKYFLS